MIKGFFPRHTGDKMQLSTRQLHLIALFEGLKGILVLLAGFGILMLIHPNLHDGAARIIEMFHMNPARHYPRVFIDLMERMSDAKLRVMAVGAAIYAASRIIEATGLWFRRTWALWFGAVSGGAFLPLEIFELFKGVSWIKVVLVVLNAAMVWVLLQSLRKQQNDEIVR
jgi:uncharacterized membrane protein (DUF2068 family)